MELPRPRPVGGEAAAGGGGGRKATHDFLSLCTRSSSFSSTLHQDPATRPPPPPTTPSAPPRENSLTTRDFLGRTNGEEDASSRVASSTEWLQPLQTLPIPSSVERNLPGGIGTCSISHVSYFTRELPFPKLETKVTRPFTFVRESTLDRTDDNSNCGSFTNSNFTLWDESAGKKGKTRKENVPLAASAVTDSEARLGQWSTSDKPAPSSSNNNHRQSHFSSLSSPMPSGQKNKGFVDMVKFTKGSSSQEDGFHHGGTEFMVKTESSLVPRAELRVKMAGKCSEQKANTPRSKHSATEQRRRSKINNRFHMLRALIPRSDQKRDRASFLMEVIEYIQMLQEKVSKYEGSQPGWTMEPAKSMPLRNAKEPGDSFVDRLCPTTNGSNTTTVFAANVDEDNGSMMSGIPRSEHEPYETDITSATAFKADMNPLGIGPFPVFLHPNLSAGTRDGHQAGHVSHSMATGFGSKTRTVECGAAALSDKLKEEGLAIDGGSKSLSNAYSHRLLNVLTQVLQSSGVDLSQSSISVQIELSKRRNPSAATTLPFPKDINTASKVHCIKNTRAGSEDSDQVLKKPKTCEEQA